MARFWFWAHAVLAVGCVVVGLWGFIRAASDPRFVIPAWVAGFLAVANLAFALKYADSR